MLEHLELTPPVVNRAPSAALSQDCLRCPIIVHHMTEAVGSRLFNYALYLQTAGGCVLHTTCSEMAAEAAVVYSIKDNSIQS